MPKKKPTLYIIDGAGHYYRAYFAIRQALTTSKGAPTNATYGFALMLRKILNEKKPDYALVAFDSKEKTFRHDMYELYKANRPDMPEDLARQLPDIDRLVDAYNIATLRAPGYEADDIIGVIAVEAAAKGYDVVIVTSDKDMMQLIRPGVRIFDSMKDRDIGPKEVEEKFGSPPDKVADVLGLMGDTSDNIPGVPGVGEKTAIALVKEYGGMEEALAAAETMTKKKLRENLTEFADQARLSKELATITLDAPVTFDPEQWKVTGPDNEKLEALFTEFEFSSLLDGVRSSRARTPRDYIAVLDTKTFKEMIAELASSGGFAVDTETTSPKPMAAKLIGMSFSCAEGRAYYLPLRHDYDGAPDQLPVDAVMPDIRRLLEDESIPKYGQNIKYDMIVLASEGVNVKPLAFDTMIASYLLNPARRHNLSTLARESLGETMIEYADVCGAGAKEIPFSQVPIDQASEYAAEDADMTYRLTRLFRLKIEQEGLVKLMEEIELPLIGVLAAMERNGVLVDAQALAALSVAMGEEMGEFERRIYEAADEEFNINSPKQLGVILFEKLQLPGARKTKTGYSTDQNTLENLSQTHPLPAMVLEYRQLAKLKNTYADALPKMINPATGRIHTSFNQTIAATGRLSSSDPNLQNIPIRRELGRHIRRAFIAPEGHLLVSADYSQIELRIMAHLSKEEAMLQAFREGEDIHTRTAAEVFGVNAALVSADMRRVAKSVNFGILYGQTAFGLARELKISRSDAQRYIDGYFKRYPRIRAYIDRLIAEAKKNGYVTTVMGRRRFLPDINASNRQARQFAERNAVNSPIQGSAADMIKIAMNAIHRRLARERFQTRMILQVHDELVFEVPEKETEPLVKMVTEEMESVADIDVPLTVETRTGLNWDEAH